MNPLVGGRAAGPPSVERAVQRALSGGVAVFTVVWVAVASSSWVGGTPSWRGGVLVVLVWSALVVRGWAMRLRRPDAWVACSVSALVLLLPALGADAVPPSVRVVLVVVPAVLAPALLRWPSALGATGMLIAVALLGEEAGLRWEAARSCWPVVVGALVVALLVPTLRRAARAVEASHRGLLRARERDALLQGRRRAHREHQRRLHDSVSTSLRSLSVEGLSRGEALRLCRTAARALEGRWSAPHVAPTLAGALEQCAALTRTPAALVLDEAAVAPPSVVLATAEAVAEALRNVDRHARAGGAEVRLERAGGGFVVRVRDDGIGLAGSPAGFGLQESVIGRMGEVGGVVTVEGDRGGGTVVTISWQPGGGGGSPPSRTTLMALTVGDVRLPLAAVVAAYLAGNAVVGASLLSGADRPWVVVAWFAALCATTGWLLVRGDRHQPAVVTAATVTAVLLLGVAGLLLVPPVGLGAGEAWPVGAVGSVLAVLALMRAPWEPLCVAAGVEVVLLVLLCAEVLDRPPWTALLTTMLSPLYGPVVGLVLAGTLTRLGRSVAADRAAESDLLLARAAAEGRAALQDRQVAEVGRGIVPFLHHLLDNPSEVGSASTRARATALAEEVRDELSLPGVLDADARSALATARAGGCAVRLRADADAVDLPGWLNAALVTVLTGAPLRRLTLTVGRSAGGTSIHLVIEPGGEVLGARVGAALAHLAPVVEVHEEVVVVALAG